MNDNIFKSFIEDLDQEHNHQYNDIIKILFIANRQGFTGQYFKRNDLEKEIIERLIIDGFKVEIIKNLFTRLFYKAYYDVSWRNILDNKELVEQYRKEIKEQKEQKEKELAERKNKKEKYKERQNDNEPPSLQITN